MKQPQRYASKPYVFFFFFDLPLGGSVIAAGDLYFGRSLPCEPRQSFPRRDFRSPLPIAIVFALKGKNTPKSHLLPMLTPRSPEGEVHTH